MKTITTLVATFCLSLSLWSQNVCDSMQIQGTFLEGNYLYLQVYNSSNHFIAYPFFTITMEENAYISPDDTLMVPTFLSIPSDANVGFTTGFYQLIMLPADQVPQGTLFEGVLTITDPNDESFSCSFPYSFTYGSMIVSIDENAETSMQLYPNPTHETLRIQTTSTEFSPKTLSVYNAMGCLVMQRSVNQVSLQAVDVAALGAGQYYLLLESEEECMHATFFKN